MRARVHEDGFVVDNDDVFVTLTFLLIAVQFLSDYCNQVFDLVGSRW